MSASLINSAIDKIEDTGNSLNKYLLTLFLVITVRIAIDWLASGTYTAFTFPGSDTWDLGHSFIHILSFFLSIFLSVMIVIKLFCSTDLKKVLKTCITFFPIIWLAPIFDILFWIGPGSKMLYLTPELHEGMLYRFFTFGGDFLQPGITPGQRIEVLLILLAICMYLRIKGTSWIKSISASFITYCIFFVYVSLPFLIDLDVIKGQFPVTIRNFYLVSIASQGIIILFLANKNIFIELIKDIRPIRIFHYITMLIFGIIVAYVAGNKTSLIQLDSAYGYKFFFLFVSIVAAAIFSIIINNLEDIEIDKVSNPDRPTITGKIPLVVYRNIGIWSFVVSIIYAWAVGFFYLFFMTLVISNYYIYSASPLRFKRIPFFSKLAISLNSLIMVYMGFYLSSDTLNLPSSVVWYVILSITAVANFIDIKDFEGDKLAGVHTLPTLLGLDRSKILIGIFFVISYLSMHFIIDDRALIPIFLIGGVIQFLQINWKNYHEKYVFLVYLFNLYFLMFYMVKFWQ